MHEAMTTYEKMVLGALNGRLGLEECEADEQRRRNVQRNLRYEINGITPVCLRIAFEQQDHLIPPRRRVNPSQPRLYRRLAAALRVNALEVFLDGGGL